MRNLIMAGTALCASCAVAYGADLPAHKSPALPPVAPIIYKWNGAYGGLNLGGGTLTHGSGGVIGGGQLGYNYQISPLFVTGLEADFQGTTLGGGGAPPFAPRSVGWLGTLRGRFGVTAFSPDLLLYGTGGFAYGGGGDGGVATGWTVGGGAEWAFSRDWSAKVEYLYADLQRGGSPGPRSGGVQAHTIRVGVNYHFDLLNGLPNRAQY